MPAYKLKPVWDPRRERLRCFDNCWKVARFAGPWPPHHATPRHATRYTLHVTRYTLHATRDTSIRNSKFLGRRLTFFHARHASLRFYPNISEPRNFSRSDTFRVESISFSWITSFSFEGISSVQKMLDRMEFPGCIFSSHKRVRHLFLFSHIHNMYTHLYPILVLIVGYCS